MLSQNKSGESTRNAFFQLAKNVNDLSPRAIAQLEEGTLRKIIRVAGPYKAPNMIQACKIIDSEYDGGLENIILLPTPEALDKLIRLPGVGPKTAACVLVYSALKKDTLPVDTHLWRVVQRLGLVELRTKTITQKAIDKIIDRLITICPDAAYAHLLFVQLGRELCKKRNPKCGHCPLIEHCNWRNRQEAANGLYPPLNGRSE
jgi:endonuclease-3